MADFTADGAQESESNDNIPEQKANKAKPTKNLPTDRVGKETQLNILRAYAKASEEQGRGAVSNNDVARFASISASSISNCNPFWNDAGLLVREGIKQRPIEAVFAYDQACEWGGDRPAAKLASVLQASWFGKPLLARLSLKSMMLNEALAFLAEECRATPEYRPQIQLLLDYLETAGLISVDGNTVSKTKSAAEIPTQTQETQQQQPGTEPPKPPPAPIGTKRFSIPIPEKDDAVITLPDNLEAEDWDMVQDYMKKYVRRWKQFTDQKDSAAHPGSHGATGGTS